MKTQIKPIIAALLLGTAMLTNAATLPNKPALKPFATGIYKSMSKPTLNVNIDKLKGAKVDISFMDSKGTVLFEDVMRKNERYYRTKINMAGLEKGTYLLELNDGTNKEVKKVEI